MPSFRQNQFSASISANPKAKDFLGEIAEETVAMAKNAKEIAVGFGKEAAREAGEIAGEAVKAGKATFAKGEQVGADLAKFAGKISPGAGLGLGLAEKVRSLSGKNTEEYGAIHRSITIHTENPQETMGALRGAISEGAKGSAGLTNTGGELGGMFPKGLKAGGGAVGNITERGRKAELGQ